MIAVELAVAYPSEVEVAFWVVLAVSGLGAFVGVVKAWAAARRGGGRRG